MLDRKLAQDRRARTKMKIAQTSLDDSYLEPPWKQNATLYSIPLGSLMSFVDAWMSIDPHIQTGLNDMISMSCSVSDALGQCNNNDVSIAVSRLMGYNDSLDKLLDDVIDGLKLKHHSTS